MKTTREQIPSNGLLRARIAAGLTGPEVADLAGTSKQTIHRLETGKQELSRYWAERLAPLLATDPVKLIFDGLSNVQIAGVVGHDRTGFIRHEPGSISVPVNVWLPGPHRWEAILVRGDGLYPTYREGEVLLYQPVARDLSSAGDVDCIVHLTDGRRVVRALMPESTPGKWLLHNEFSAPLRDQEIDWAAPVQFVHNPIM